MTTDHHVLTSLDAIEQTGQLLASLSQRNRGHGGGVTEEGLC